MCTTTNEEDSHRYHRYINKDESVAGTVSGNHEAVYRAFMFGFAGQELQNYLVIFGNLALKITWYWQISLFLLALL